MTSGQQGGAVPAGDLRPGLEDAIRVMETRAEDCRADNLHAARRAYALGADTLRARIAEQPASADDNDDDQDMTVAQRAKRVMDWIDGATAELSLSDVMALRPAAARLADGTFAEQPAPGGTGAGGVEGLRPGLEEALRIVEAKRQTVPTASLVHDACVSLMSLFRARLAATPEMNERVDG